MQPTTVQTIFFWWNIFRILTEIIGLHVSICMGVDLDKFNFIFFTINLVTEVQWESPIPVSYSGDTVAIGLGLF